MATRALDVVSILHALKVLSGETGVSRWNPKNEEQTKVLGWLDQHEDLLAQVTGLKAKASTLYQELNALLESEGFSPMIQPFDPTLGIGVVSILDKLVEWLSGPGQLVNIATEQGMKPGFQLPASDVTVHKVEGFPNSFLLELKTKGDDTLWLLLHDQDYLQGLRMVDLAMTAMTLNRQVVTHQVGHGHRPTARYEQTQVYAGVKIPMLDFDIKPNIGWLIGADAFASDRQYWSIDQAMQQFKLRMNEEGARVKVATAVVAMRSMVEEPVPFVVDRPFYGWFTQKGLEGLPIGVFFADWDAMKQPAGSLEDL